MPIPQLRLQVSYLFLICLYGPRKSLETGCLVVSNPSLQVWCLLDEGVWEHILLPYVIRFWTLRNIFPSSTAPSFGLAFSCSGWCGHSLWLTIYLAELEKQLSFSGLNCYSPPHRKCSFCCNIFIGSEPLVHKSTGIFSMLRYIEIYACNSSRSSDELISAFASTLLTCLWIMHWSFLWFFQYSEIGKGL